MTGTIVQETSAEGANGDEELYDSQNDPYEWTNLAALPGQKEKLDELRALGPKTFAALVPAKDQSLPRLRWRAASETGIPASRPDANTFEQCHG